MFDAEHMLNDDDDDDEEGDDDEEEEVSDDDDDDESEVDDDDNSLGTFAIRVVYESGRPVIGTAVSCKYQAGGVGTEYTDDEGWAHFNVYGGFTGTATNIKRIWINGIEVGEEFDPLDEDFETQSFVLPES